MDSILEFLSKWVARPVSIVGALITLYLAAVAIANGDLKDVFSAFGAPDFSVALPAFTVPNLGPAPTWLVEFWGLDWVRKWAIFLLLVVFGFSAAFLGLFFAFMTSALPWIGAIALAPALLLGVWVWLRQYATWFERGIETLQFSYTIDPSGAVLALSPAPSAGPDVGYGFIAAAIITGYGIGGFVGGLKNHAPGSAAPITTFVLVVSTIGMLIFGGMYSARNLAAPTPILKDAPANVSCSLTDLSQVKAYAEQLRTFVGDNRPPKPHARGPLSSQAFLPEWYGFVHSCVKPDGQIFNRFRLLVSSATRLDPAKVRCDIALVDGMRRQDGIVFDRYEFVQSFYGADCDSFHDGQIAAEVRKYMPDAMLARVWVDPVKASADIAPDAPAEK